MKKQYLILSMIAISLMLTACNDTHNLEIKEAENNVTIKPVGDISAKLQTYPFEEAIKVSELIAEIKIIEKVQELNEPSPKTIFKATMTEVLKNDSGLPTDSLHFMQQGNSDWTFNDNEMFQQGEKYILFLKHAKEIQEEHTYWILGEETGMYKIINDRYIAKLSERDEALADIEDIKLSDELKKSKNSKEIQVLQTEEFREKIKKSLMRN
ncbi:MAG: hypothetical protein ACK4M9_03525 [Anaerobacillus sp.]|uniref:hypothetical protein n=1 Tax=Anaerobacillus sp. TaxID=1872506 RepID=UPI003918CD06